MSPNQQSEAFVSRKHLFEYLLRQEHERAWRVGKWKGVSSYKGMGTRGNTLRYNPTMAAAMAFLDYGYTLENLTELCLWYRQQGEAKNLADFEELGRYLQQFFKKGQR